MPTKLCTTIRCKLYNNGKCPYIEKLSVTLANDKVWTREICKRNHK